MHTIAKALLCITFCEDINISTTFDIHKDFRVKLDVYLEFIRRGEMICLTTARFIEPVSMQNTTQGAGQGFVTV